MTEKNEQIVYSISEFCRLVGKSRPWFYALPADQKPKVLHRGLKTRFITHEEVRRFLELPA